MFNRIKDAREHAKEMRFAKDHLEAQLSDGVDPEVAADATVKATVQKFGASSGSGGGRSLDIEKLMSIIALVMQLLEMFKAKTVSIIIAIILVAAAAGPASACHGSFGSRLGLRAGSCGASLSVRGRRNRTAVRWGGRRTYISYSLSGCDSLQAPVQAPSK